MGRAGMLSSWASCPSFCEPDVRLVSLTQELILFLARFVRSHPQHFAGTDAPPPPPPPSHVRV